jgi:hypothetical protein
MNAWYNWLQTVLDQNGTLILLGCLIGIFQVVAFLTKTSWRQRERANTVTGRLGVVLSWGANGIAILALALGGSIYYFKGGTGDANFIAGLWCVFGVVIFLIGQALLFVFAGPPRVTIEQNQSLEKAP